VGFLYLASKPYVGAELGASAVGALASVTKPKRMRKHTYDKVQKLVKLNEAGLKISIGYVDENYCQRCSQQPGSPKSNSGNQTPATTQIHARTEFQPGWQCVIGREAFWCYAP
jgi:hypothetical protein